MSTRSRSGVDPGRLLVISEGPWPARTMDLRHIDGHRLPARALEAYARARLRVACPLSVGKDAGMHPAAEIDIDAPLDVVWGVMLDTPAYGAWNPFVERAETAAPPRVGNPIVLHVVWANGRRTRSPERITALEAPTTDAGGTTAARMSYVYEGLPSRLGLVRGVRHQRLAQRPGGPTTYATVEEFSGPLVRLAGPARVADGFRLHAEGLKRRAESLASGQGG